MEPDINQDYKKIELKLNILSSFVLVGLIMPFLAYLVYFMAGGIGSEPDYGGGGILLILALGIILIITSILLFFQIYYLIKIREFPERKSLLFPKTVTSIASVALLLIAVLSLPSIYSSYNNQREFKIRQAEENKKIALIKMEYDNLPHKRYVYFKELFSKPIPVDKLKVGSFDTTFDYHFVPKDVPKSPSYGRLDIKGLGGEGITKNWTTHIILGKNQDSFFSQDSVFRESLVFSDGRGYIIEPDSISTRENTFEKRRLSLGKFVTIEIPPENDFLRTYEYGSTGSVDSEAFQAKVIGESGVILNDLYVPIPQEPINQLIKKDTDNYTEKYHDKLTNDIPK